MNAERVTFGPMKGVYDSSVVVSRELEISVLGLGAESAMIERRGEPFRVCGIGVNGEGRSSCVARRGTDTTTALSAMICRYLRGFIEGGIIAVGRTVALDRELRNNIPAPKMLAPIKAIPYVHGVFSNNARVPHSATIARSSLP